MTEEVLNGLDARLRQHICTLKKASTDTTNKIPMCESNLKVVNFDKVPNEFARGKGWKAVPKSNDALYIDIHGHWHFIEFKNGKNIKEGDLYRKLYDSLLMLMEWGVIPEIEFVRKNIDYILVYNDDKHEKIPVSPAREATYRYIMGLSKREEKLWGIENFEKYLFNETHTYAQSVFEKQFIRPKELEEGLI